MTEAEWLECGDARRMLDLMTVRVSEGELRLFVCSYCRRVWQVLYDPRLRESVTWMEEAGEAVNDLAGFERAKADASAALDAIVEDANEQRWYYAERYAAEAVCLSLSDRLTAEVARKVSDHAMQASCLSPAGDEPGHEEREARAQAGLLREVLGSPFQT